MQKILNTYKCFGFLAYRLVGGIFSSFNISANFFSSGGISYGSGGGLGGGIHCGFDFFCKINHIDSITVKNYHEVFFFDAKSEENKSFRIMMISDKGPGMDRLELRQHRHRTNLFMLKGKPLNYNISVFCNN